MPRHQPGGARLADAVTRLRSCGCNRVTTPGRWVNLGIRVVTNLSGTHPIELGGLPFSPPAGVGTLVRAGYTLPEPIFSVFSALVIGAAAGAAALFGGGYLVDLGGGRSDSDEVIIASAVFGLVVAAIALYSFRFSFVKDYARFLGTEGFARVCRRSKDSYLVPFRAVGKVSITGRIRKTVVYRTFSFFGHDGRLLARERGQQILKRWARGIEVDREDAICSFATAAAKACAATGARIEQ